jgi:GTP-binding protein
MKIKKAEFIVSNTSVDKCPDQILPEYAFIGRSNVGKSSLINMLTGNKNLAKTSGKPGKTQLINHFKINDNWFLVDLPGYGYAKVSKSKRELFKKFIRDYLLKRRQLVCIFVLIDSRLEPQRPDLDFMEFLGEQGIPFCMVFTKTDKLKTHALNRNIKDYLKFMTSTRWESAPLWFATSAVTANGKEELLNYIESLNNEFFAHQQ